MLKTKKIIKFNNKGMAALLTIVIVGAAALIMAYSASILGLGELDLGYTAQQGAETFSIADGCAEEALRKLRLNPSYSGETLSLGAGSCIISVSAAGNDRSVSVSANVGTSYYKNLNVGLTLSGTNLDVITINSWEEN